MSENLIARMIISPARLDFNKAENEEKAQEDDGEKSKNRERRWGRRRKNPNWIVRRGSNDQNSVESLERKVRGGEKRLLIGHWRFFTSSERSDLRSSSGFRENFVIIHSVWKINRASEINDIAWHPRCCATYKSVWTFPKQFLYDSIARESSSPNQKSVSVRKFGIRENWALRKMH